MLTLNTKTDMKGITIEAQMRTEQDAYGLINNLSSSTFKATSTPNIKKHVLTALKHTGTGIARILTNDTTKREAVQIMQDIRKTYPVTLVSIKAFYFDNREGKFLTIMELPIQDEDKTLERIKQFDLKIDIQTLKQ